MNHAVIERPSAEALWPHQVLARAGVGRAWREHRGERPNAVLLVMPTGCHEAGQLVLMHDGSMKHVEDVVVGDRLMGPDSAPREVLQLCRGAGRMVRIVPTRGAPFVVNEDHVLTLVKTAQKPNGAPCQREGAVVDVTVRDWLGWTKSQKHLYKLFRVGVEFPDNGTRLSIDPYFLGVLLGDGTIRAGLGVSKEEPAIIDECEAQALAHGLKVTAFGTGSSVTRMISSGTRGGAHNRNPIIEKLKALGLYGTSSGNKFIPSIYKTASREARLALLAGLLDTDGHCHNSCFDYISKSEQLAVDVAFIARSLGLSAYAHAEWKQCQTGAGGYYFRVSISGETDQIPTRITRKQAAPRRQKKNVLRTGFSVEILSEQRFYGFTLDGDGRYLLDDFTVTHNSGKTRTAVDCVLAALARGLRVLWIVHRRELAEQARARMQRDGAGRVGIILDGKPSTDPDAFVQIASAQTLASNGSRPPADLIVWDEAHHCVAETFRKVAAAYPKAYHLGLTATPERSDGTALGNVFSHLVAPVSIRQLIAAGTLVPCDVIAPPKATTALAMDPLVAYQTHAGGERAVVFAESVASARELAQRFNEAGITAGFIDASQTVTERDDVLSRFKNGALRVVVNVYVLTEGYDDPSLSVCILARGCGSAGMFLQIVGRVLRASKGKSRATLIDLRGAVHRHGLPDEDRVYSLEGKPIRQTSTTLRISRCKECGAVFRVATECPRCGAALETKQQQSVKNQKLSKIARVASAEEKLATWKRFCLHARQHGWKPGSAAHRFKAVYGHWPERSFPTYSQVCAQERAAWINAHNEQHREQHSEQGAA